MSDSARRKAPQADKAPQAAKAAQAGKAAPAGTAQADTPQADTPQAGTGQADTAQAGGEQPGTAQAAAPDQATAAATPAGARGGDGAKPDIDEVKRKFREALDRKRESHAEGSGTGGRDSGKIHGAHGHANDRRSFRRKSG